MLTFVQGCCRACSPPLCLGKRTLSRERPPDLRMRALIEHERPVARHAVAPSPVTAATPSRMPKTYPRGKRSDLLANVRLHRPSSASIGAAVTTPGAVTLHRNSTGPV